MRELLHSYMLMYSSPNGAHSRRVWSWVEAQEAVKELQREGHKVRVVDEGLVRRSDVRRVQWVPPEDDSIA
jgi:hypothetical protein